MEGVELSREQQGEAAVLPGGSPSFSQHLAHPTRRVRITAQREDRAWRRPTVHFPGQKDKVGAQTMLKLPHSYTHLTCYQSNAQNSPSQASTVREP